MAPRSSIEVASFWRVAYPETHQSLQVAGLPTWRAPIPQPHRLGEVLLTIRSGA